jgi:UDP-N-acetylmuramoyl-tripeptide--D-alanyl-D-alanine ligase
MATPIPANNALLTATAAAAATAGAVLFARREPVAARGITSDSRAVSPGCAFVALRGERVDGHDYLEAAVGSGATLLVVEKGRAPSAASVGANVDVVEVADTLVAWGDLAKAHLREWRRRSELEPRRTVAITGSAGKTTTKELCATLLAIVGPVHATSGNLNNRVGVPAVAFGVEAHHRFAVFEAGMSVRGEIAALASILEADVAVITNVGLAHAAGVGGSRDDVAREKGDLFAALAPGRTAVACFDDDAAMRELARAPAASAVTFGTGEGADYRLLERVASGVDGAAVRIQRRRDGTEAHIWLPMLGEAAAVDLAAALGAAEAVAGPLEAEAITGALRSHAHPPGRMQVRQLADGTTLLDDTYNANPQSMRAALQTLGEVARGRRAVVVVGEMRELGDLASQEHTSLGASIASSGARIAVSCGGLADLAVLAAELAGVAQARAVDAAGAANLATGLVLPRDVVLVKASRSVGAERVVDALARAHGGEVHVPTERA